MQTILGSGGAIGIELAKALKEFTSEIRLISRNPEKINPTDELLSADLLNRDDVFEAVKGSSVVYVTVGFQYSIKSWKANWPPFISYVIDACKKHNCKLVFFDNIYMYDSNYLDGMTEETPINPVSEKGEIRTKIAQMIMDEVEAGQLTALIARSADFYGPTIINNSMLTETVFNSLSNGKKANWMGSVNFKHSFTYTPDAGKATAILGNTEDAFNQIWHMPTASNPFTGKEWIETIAEEMGVEPKYQVAPKFLVRIIGLFVPIMKEMVEMIYQYDRDYIFDSSKFEKRFNFVPTSYIDGIRKIIETDYKK
ncbi:MAG: NAD-dependent epimerase/dehydratase family protein [Candidatus Marinimicrobia bacterium]|nr:NAD-dependent epimerase/dehydratase family protein [Candidatus Neomarinimicrobiota bacterium]